MLLHHKRTLRVYQLNLAGKRHTVQLELTPWQKARQRDLVPLLAVVGYSLSSQTSLHQDYQGNQILMPSQLQKVHKWMMETHQGLVGFVEEMLLDQSDAAHQDAMFLPLLSTPRKTPVRQQPFRAKEMKNLFK